MEYLTYIVLLLVLIYLVASTFYIELPHQPKSLNSFCQQEKKNRLEEKGYFSDKLKAKEYLEREYPEINFAKVIYSTNNPETLRNIKLPGKFVMKSSTGARMFYLGTDKDNIEDLIKKAKGFLDVNYSNYGYRSIPFMELSEPHYDYNKDPKIFIEEFLEGIKEFRIMMAKGELLYLEKIDENGLAYYDENWDQIVDPKYNTVIELKKRTKPNCINKIIGFCKEFYQKTNLQFVRMDFYLSKDETEYYFGEFTFTPENCRRKYSKNFNKKYGTLFG